MINRKYALLIPILLTPIPLLAYLDPGSGSMLFSALIGIIATLFFVTKGLFYKLLSLPAYIAGKKAGIKHDSHRIVFYCEGARYWPVFQPVIEELERRGTKVSYLTSDKNDPALSREWTHIETKYIGVGNKAFFLLNTLQTDICVMTTPGLDVLQIKRSRGVKKYVHITHSAGGCSGYATFGLDYYDVVLTGGEADKKLIKELESVRNIEKKQVEVIGCTYLDVLREKPQAEPLFSNNNKSVIISPTWGAHGLLSQYGETILAQLVAATDYNIIIRPHPQSFVAEKAMVDQLQKSFPQSDRLIWDTNPDGLRAMKSADIMISDFSGIIFDYLFLFERPVLTLKAEYDKRGKDSMDIADDPWNIQVLDKIGGVITKDETANIGEIVKQKLMATEGVSTLLPELHNDMDKYPSESGKRGADVIEQLLLSKKSS
ncbi:CDP-glycerol glycerophosphotransferase family protein [bacterium]|nr:CDP-glycerol glycerophosphotransferase family protein [bacterium]